MDKKAIHDAPYTADLHLPGGNAYRGKFAVRGINALLFFPEDALQEDWRAIESAELHATLSGLSGACRLNVVFNGTLGHGYDLTVTGGLDGDAARELGMTLGGSRLTRERADRYLTDFNTRGLALIGDSLRAFTLNLGDHLFDLSTSPQHGISGRHEHYDALNSLKRNNKTFIAGMLEQLEAELAHPEKPRSKRGEDVLEEADASDLDLVGLSEIEEKLALDRITTDAVNLYRVDLESLTLRTGDLLALGAARVKTPFHPAYLCRSFRDALHRLGFSPSVIQDSLKFFHREWIKKLRGFYARLNNGLASDGLRPGLEDELYNTGSIMDSSGRRPVYKRGRPEQADDSGDPGDAKSNAAGGTEAANSSADTPARPAVERRGRQGRRATD